MTQNTAQALYESWLPTGYLTDAALNCYDRATLSKPLWRGIAATQVEAYDYYYSLDLDTQRSEACEILGADGWTVSQVSYRKA